MSPELRYRPLPPDRPARELEEELLKRWKSEKLFDSTLKAHVGGKEWVFFEGPPTANGRPGIHHVFARTVKDLFCRHRAMLGYHVDRKAGWDTHGLPVEVEVEKALGIKGKQDIERIGVEEFNRRCRESVWKYREEWEGLSQRMGYWLDYDHPYVTYSNEYVESVWWALKTLSEKGFLVKGHKILPYCPRCGTSLSSHEVQQGYEEVEDPSVFLALDLEAPREGVKRRRIVVWTTTPWTLVSNAALAVHPDLAYIEVRKGADKDWTLILAETRAAAVLGQEWSERWEVVARYAGKELAGLRYRRPIDWATYPDGNHEIIVAEEFVSAEDGSGVVHMSPAFGADDYAAGKKHGLVFLQPVDARGEFPAGMPVVGGKFVKDADPLIIEELKRRDVLWKAATITHSYPHCWRCDTPLLYYARDSWFVKTTAFRDSMIANNGQVNWNPPETGARRFGDWLENNIDWAISRDRYWGTPLPVWVCDADDAHREVIGSYAELEERGGRARGKDFDPHKPYIDAWSWPCTRCSASAPAQGGVMRRTPEVIDAWFDSGSMPFAQWHYPFEGREAFARHYPGDFIAEGVDQTRGWFYSLLAIATGLGQEVPYRSVVVNDLVLDANGQKMSKSRGNTVDPNAVMERHGADAVRLFLVSSAQVWLPRRFDEAVIRETAGRFLITLKNLYHGSFAQYANFGWSPSPSDPAPAGRPLIDRWILSELARTEQSVHRDLNDFDATGAGKAIIEFVDNDVSKWYVRSSRRRFYDVETPDSRAAFATLHEVLCGVCRLLAPIAPFVSDWIHRELTGESVHLQEYPQGGLGRDDNDLSVVMESIRELARLGRAAREDAKVPVRQPLARMVCVTSPYAGRAADMLRELTPLLEAEMNVKRIEFATSADALVRLEAKPNFRSLGKVWGKETPRAASAVSALSSDALMAFERGEPVVISVDGRDHVLHADDVTVVRKASGALVVQQDGPHFAAIDPTVTPELRDEGIARELVSRIQRLRKESGLAVSDRIALWIAGPAAVQAAAEGFRQWIAGEVLARELVLGDTLPDAAATATVDLDGATARIALTRDS